MRLTSKPRLAPIAQDRIDALKQDKGAIEAALDTLGTQWDPKARKYHCPFHEDSTASMTLHQAADGVWRAICHGACTRTGWDVFALVCEAKGWPVGQGQSGLPRAFRFITGSQKALGYTPSSFSRSIRARPEGPTLRDVLGVSRFDQLTKGEGSKYSDKTVELLCDGRSWPRNTPGVPLAIERGNLRFGYSKRSWNLGAPDGVSCWFIGSPRTTYCEARRLDEPQWWGGGKCRLVGGSRNGMPLGTHEVGQYPQIYMAEGGPDYIQAHTLAAMHQDPDSVGVVGMLGGKFNLGQEAIEALSGKAIRILAHHDDAGSNAAERWASTLRKAGALVAVIHVGDIAERWAIQHGDGFDLDDLLAHPSGPGVVVHDRTLFFGPPKKEYGELPLTDFETVEVAA